MTRDEVNRAAKAPVRRIDAWLGAAAICGAAVFHAGLIRGELLGFRAELAGLRDTVLAAIEDTRIGVAERSELRERLGRAEVRIDRLEDDG